MEEKRGGDEPYKHVRRKIGERFRHMMVLHHRTFSYKFVRLMEDYWHGRIDSLMYGVAAQYWLNG
jgi:hypothetical protein